MSIEKDGNRPKEGDSFNPLNILQAKKLYTDVWSDWPIGINGDPNNYPTLLEPKKHYAERYNYGRDSVFAKQLIELSDPEAVTAYDQLVDEFNADLERIKATKDQEAVRAFYRRACDLINSRR